MENISAQSQTTKEESQSVASIVPIVEKEVLFGVLFGGEKLSKEDRKIIRAWLVTTAQYLDKRLYHTNKLSDRELVIRYIKDEDFKAAYYIQSACDPQPKIMLVLIIILLISVVLTIKWPELAILFSGSGH